MYEKRDIFVCVLLSQIANCVATSPWSLIKHCWRSFHFLSLSELGKLCFSLFFIFYVPSHASLKALNLFQRGWHFLYVNTDIMTPFVFIHKSCVVWDLWQMLVVFSWSRLLGIHHSVQTLMHSYICISVLLSYSVNTQEQIMLRLVFTWCKVTKSIGLFLTFWYITVEKAQG